MGVLDLYEQARNTLKTAGSTVNKAIANTKVARQAANSPTAQAFTNNKLVKAADAVVTGGKQLVQGAAQGIANWAGGQLGTALGQSLAANQTAKTNQRIVNQQNAQDQILLNRLKQAQREGNQAQVQHLTKTMNNPQLNTRLSLNKLVSDYQQGQRNAIVGAGKTAAAAAALPKVIAGVATSGPAAALLPVAMGSGGSAISQKLQGGPINWNEAGKRGTDTMIMSGLLQPINEKISNGVAKAFGAKTNALATSTPGYMSMPASKLATAAKAGAQGAISGALNAIPQSAAYSALAAAEDPNVNNLPQGIKATGQKFVKDLPGQMAFGAVLGGLTQAYYAAKTYDQMAEIVDQYNRRQYGNAGNYSQDELQQMRHDAFKTLGLPEDASDEEIYSTWRKLIAKNHPDRHPNDRAVYEVISKDINSAYNNITKGTPFKLTSANNAPVTQNQTISDNEINPNTGTSIMNRNAGPLALEDGVVSSVMQQHGLTPAQQNQLRTPYNNAYDVLRGVKDYGEIGNIIEQVAKATGYTDHQIIVAKKQLFRHLLEHHGSEYLKTNGEVDVAKILAFVKEVNYPSTIGSSQDYYNGVAKVDQNGNPINKLEYYNDDTGKMSVVKMNNDLPGTSSVVTSFTKNDYNDYVNQQKNTPDTRVFEIDRVGQQPPTVKDVSSHGGRHLAVSPADHTGLDLSVVNKDIIPQKPENVKTQNDTQTGNLLTPTNSDVQVYNQRRYNGYGRRREYTGQDLVNDYLEKYARGEQKRNELEKQKNDSQIARQSLSSLSDSANIVYGQVLDTLSQASSPKVQKAAQMGATLLARRAERYAQDLNQIEGVNTHQAEDYLDNLQINANAIQPVEGGLNQPAYHGTGAVFDKFDSAYNRTGEGANAHGYGHYFALNREVANKYRFADAQDPEYYYKGQNIKEWISEDGDEIRNKYWEPAEDLLYSRDLDYVIGNWEQALQEAKYRGDKQLAQSLQESVDFLHDIEQKGDDTGSLFEVDIPENNYLLDLDRPLDQQPEYVQQAINKLPKEILEEIDPENNPYHVTYTGKDLYDTIAEYFNQSAGKGDLKAEIAEAEKKASELLYSVGIKGNKYNGFVDGPSFVIFNDNDINIIERYNQAINDKIRGQIVINEGWRTMNLFESADESTFFHELGHLSLDDLKTLGEMEGASGQTLADWQEVKAWLGYKDDQTIFSPQQQEKFARGLESYLREGKTENEGLKEVFERIKQWFVDLYRSFRELGGKVPENIRQVMERLFTTQEEERGIKIAGEAREKKIKISDFDRYDPFSASEYVPNPNIKITDTTEQDIPDKIRIPNTENSKYNVGRNTGERVVLEKAVNQLENDIGKPLTHDEIGKAAENIDNYDVPMITREETKEFGARILRNRQRIARLANGGKVTKELMDAMRADADTAANLARLLEQRRIVAQDDLPFDQKRFHEVLKRIEDQGHDMNKVWEKAQDVDWENKKEVDKFYRQYIKPDLEEWLDTYRYFNMLSSPKTQQRNILSNAIGSGIVEPTRLAVAGMIGKDRTPMEAVEYVKAFYDPKNIKKAAQNFSKSLKGESEDNKYTGRYFAPLATEDDPEALQKLEKVLKTPGRVLEAFDQFFGTIVYEGELAAMNKRYENDTNRMISKTQAAKKLTDEVLFRAKLGENDGSKVLNFIDDTAKWITSGRQSKNTILRTLNKWSIPFVKVPVNTLKAGLEYSPAGWVTLWGATDKDDQAAKAIIGTVVHIGMIGLAYKALKSAKFDITGAEPSSTAERNLFRASGRRAYSVRIGNKWYSYRNLHPTIVYSLAFAAGLKHSLEDGDKSAFEAYASGITAMAEAFADDSMMKNLGTLIDALQGDEWGQTQLLSNYIQQVIPARALQSWLARTIDPYQRVANANANKLQKQIQYIIRETPIVSQILPIRTDEYGDRVENTDRLLNAVSPVGISSVNPEAEETYQLKQEEKRIKNQAKKEKNQIINEAGKVNQDETNIVQKILGTNAAREDNNGVDVYDYFVVPEDPARRKTQKSLIKTKIEYGRDVTSGELKFYYLSDVLDMPNDTKVEAAQRNKKLFDKYDKVEEDEYLTAEQKRQLQDTILRETGISPEQMAYYRKASDATNTNMRVLTVEDDLDKYGINPEDQADHERLIEYLKNNRKTVGGKYLVYPGVLEELRKRGWISKDEEKYLKSLEWDEETGDWKSDEDESESSGSGSGSGKSKSKSSGNIKFSSSSGSGGSGTKVGNIKISAPSVSPRSHAGIKITGTQPALKINAPQVDPEEMIKIAQSK